MLMLPMLCHLDNDRRGNNNHYTVYIYILRSTHDLHTLPGDTCFSRYPSVALARNIFIYTSTSQSLLASAIADCTVR
jgi:hypothetical protein